MSDNRLFIFICENMGVGGIQTYIYNATKSLNENGYCVIFAHKISYPFDQNYRKLIDNVPNSAIEMSV